MLPRFGADGFNGLSMKSQLAQIVDIQGRVTLSRTGFTAQIAAPVSYDFALPPFHCEREGGATAGRAPRCGRSPGLERQPGSPVLRLVLGACKGGESRGPRIKYQFY
jgi:hypothetical protein